MILWACSKAENQAVRDPSGIFSLLHHDGFQIVDGKLQLPDNVSSVKKHADADALQLEDASGCSFVIFFAKHSDGFDFFSHYQISGSVITLGSDLLDDLYLDDSRLSASQIMIDFYQHCVIDRRKSGICALNGRPFDEMKFEEGDLLQVLNVQMILLDQSFSVCRVSNLYTGLHPSVEKETEAMPFSDETISVVRRYRCVHFENTFEKELEEPDPLPSSNHRSSISALGMALTMSGGSLALALFNAHNQVLNGRDPMELLAGILMPGLMLASALFWRPLQRHLDQKEDQKAARKRLSSYSRYLGNLGASIQKAERENEAELEECFPAQNELIAFSSNDLIYQKLPQQKDWLVAACGRGTLTYKISLTHSFRFLHDDRIPLMIENLQHQLSAQKNGIVTFSMLEHRRIALEEDQDLFLEWLIEQLTQFYAPDVLRIAFLADEKWISNHAWIRSIPHTVDPSGVRLIARKENEARELSKLLHQEEKAWPILIVQKQALLAAVDHEKNTRIVLVENHCIPADTSLRIVMQNNGGQLIKEDGVESFTGTYHSTDLFRFFQHLNRYQMEGAESARTDNPCFLDLYQVDRVNELKMEERWKKNHTSRKLEGVLGINRNGEKILLDLDENGNGPHGLIAGTTGSGKSALITSLILSLAVEYSPMDVQFVLIDFKGGGAAQVFANQQGVMPHIAGVLSNLELDGMERALVSFSKECQKREQLFCSMSAICGSSVMNLDSYRKAWKKDCGLPSLASLVIVVDEFAELKKEKPDFMKDLISLARVGRSLGIHLILATQKPSGVVDEQIWSNSRFKICLKVQDRQDSMEMIHQPDASWIRKPGEFYLLCDGILAHGDSGYSGARGGEKVPSASLIDLNGAIIQSAEIKGESRNSQAAEIVQEIIRLGKQMQYRAEPLWMDELRSISWNEIAQEEGIVLGRIDDYYSRTQPLLKYDQSRGQHMAVFSIDRSEKLSFLRMLMKSILNSAPPKTEIDMIDGLGMHCPKTQCGCLSGWINGDETDQVHHLYQHLMTGEKRDGCTYLILNDLGEFIDSDAENRNLIHTLLEKGEQKKVHMILLASSPSAFHYRDLALIPFRISLHNENKQELASIFETPVKQVVRKNGTGMVKTDHLLEFCWMKTEDDDVENALKERDARLHEEKLYTIPTIPETISLSTCQKEGIVLGMELSSCQYVVIPKESILLVLSTYEEEYDAFLQLMKQSGADVYQAVDDASLKDCPIRSGLMIFMSLALWQRSTFKNNPKYPLILYIGAGFRDQYQFNCSYKKEMKANMAVFYQRGRNQVIQLAETQ